VAGEPGVAVQVVVTQRFLDPGQALRVESAAALQRLAQGEPLVVVSDQGDPVPGRLPDVTDRGDVAGRAVPPDPELQGGEPAFGEQFPRLAAGGRRRDQPNPVPVTGP